MMSDNVLARTKQFKPLDNTLKDIQKVCDSITERFFRATGPWTKYFERFL